MPPMKRGAWPYALQNPIWHQQLPPYELGPMPYPGARPNQPSAFLYPPPGFPAFTWPIAPMPNAEPSADFLQQSRPQQSGLVMQSPLMAFLSGDEDQEYEENPEAIPALYDPEEDEPASYEMCIDRCHQANRQAIRDCYKKRGKVAKAICIAQAGSRHGSCIAACNKYRNK